MEPSLASYRLRLPCGHSAAQGEGEDFRERITGSANRVLVATEVLPPRRLVNGRLDALLQSERRACAVVINDDGPVETQPEKLAGQLGQLAREAIGCLDAASGRLDG